MRAFVLLKASVTKVSGGMDVRHPFSHVHIIPLSHLPLIPATQKRVGFLRDIPLAPIRPRELSRPRDLNMPGETDGWDPCHVGCSRGNLART